MAYIASKPVRFDRTYAVGEIIPDEIIDPRMTRRLVEMGRIISVDLPDSGSNAGTSLAPPEESAEGEGGTNTQNEPEAPVEGAENGVHPPAESEDELETPVEGAEDSIQLPAESENEPVPKPETGGKFACPDCGKAFGSKNALSAHSRTHKE